jgi:hypothetical protein
MDENKEEKKLTNAPKSRNYGLSSSNNGGNPLSSNKVYPGDSVDSHKELEEVNQYLNEGEISQQNNNL